MSDESRLEVMLPSVLLVKGDSQMLRLWKSTAIAPDHPALELADWYVKQRGLVAVVIDQPLSDSRFHEGCVVSVYLTPAGRLALLKDES